MALRNHYAACLSPAVRLCKEWNLAPDNNNAQGDGDNQAYQTQELICDSLVLLVTIQSIRTGMGQRLPVDSCSFHFNRREIK